jgi:hypothetical protein
VHLFCSQTRLDAPPSTHTTTPPKTTKQTKSAPGARRRFGLNWSQAAELRRYAPMLIAEVEVEGTMREASSQGFRKIARFIFGGNTAAAAAAAAASSSEPIAMTSPVRQELVAGGDAAAGGTSKGRSEPIAMTSPVVMEMAGGSEALAAGDSGRVRMSFVMPSKYTAATLPKPNDATVAIKEVRSMGFGYLRCLKLLHSMFDAAHLPTTCSTKDPRFSTPPPPHHPPPPVTFPPQVPAATVAALSWRGHVRGREIVERRKRQLLDIMAAEGIEPEGDLVLLQYHPPFTVRVVGCAALRAACVRAAFVCAKKAQTQDARSSPQLPHPTKYCRKLPLKPY